MSKIAKRPDFSLAYYDPSRGVKTIAVAEAAEKLSRLARCKVLNVEGEASTMAVSRYRWAEQGMWKEWIRGNLSDVKARMTNWVQKVEAQAGYRR